MPVNVDFALISYQRNEKQTLKDANQNLFPGLPHTVQSAGLSHVPLSTYCVRYEILQ